MKPKLYLDTSIPNAYFDSKVPLRQLLTQKWFVHEAINYAIFISSLTLEEINRTKDEKLKTDILDLLFSFNPVLLEVTKDIIALAKIYIKKGAVPKYEINDALHIAIAVCNNISFLASWNFKHIVRAKTIKEINELNLSNKYNIIEIGSLEIFGGAKYGNLS